MLQFGTVGGCSRLTKNEFMRKLIGMTSTPHVRCCLQTLLLATGEMPLTNM
jgi:hypothetical protein